MLDKPANKYKHVQHHTKSPSTPNTPNLSFLESGQPQFMHTEKEQ